MSDLQLIEQTLTVAARRRRRERALRGLWQGMLAGVIIVFATVAAYKLLPLPAWSLRAALAVGGAVAVAGLIIGAWHKDSLTETARWVDGRQHLQERLSTALEMAKAPGPESWRELLVSDAAAHLKEFDSRRLVQFRFTRASRWAFLLLALTIGLGFAPVFRSKAYLQKQADQNVIQDAGRHLVELTKQSLSSHPPALESTEKAMDAVNDLGDQLTKKAMTRAEALKDLTKVSDRLKDEMQNLATDPALKRMQQAARAQGDDSSSNAAALQKQMADAQKQLGNSTATPQDMDKLNQDLNKLQQEAKSEADKNGDLSPADREKISQSLAALAKQAQDMGLNMPNLDQAVQALAASQTGLFLKDMQASMTDLQKMSDLAKSLQQLQQQMDKIGKDLAEQLQNGQPEAAQATLQKMIDQLKSASLTPEQLQKMLAEVSKAVDPAGKYGKVADYLSQAAQQMQQGQQPGAAQSLADASKELDKLMQQMGDAKALMAEMDALSRASMSVGTCTSWGQCQGTAGFNPRGLHPGKGVGTWADENGGWGYDGQKPELTDNSAMKRPDMTARGQTDRGDGELSDALKPTQVKGKFSPGGQMPSITLKGVSIKGTSSVTLDQATVAAQQDAQSALSQEKVPRAYQGAVRDYFDDFKK
jgi:hypothetical protein